ncbi:MAG: helix-turn-helix domain-containing protein [Alphaproteobacteria bacterium]|nr:helix-turn-helix domain-containing protein [Alphaproteobacteria bacterium]
MLETMNSRLADHLKRLRLERMWSLDQLAERSGVSRASLSRIENAEVSPTAEVLGKLCTAYALPLSRLLAQVEEQFAPLCRQADQQVWTEAIIGYQRRVISPAVPPLRAEVVECILPANTEITYDAPPIPGLEHHLILQKGALDVWIGTDHYCLSPGDCLRYTLFSSSRFKTPKETGATYLFVLL